jgi:glycosyltransferase involved in cell wall biosynthesis
MVKILACVPVYNEEKLLPHFLRRYERFCDSILVYDNGSTDRTLEIAEAHPLVRIRTFRTDGFDDAAFLAILTAAKTEARGAFDWVILPDCDELLLGDVRGILSSAPSDVLTPLGYCLVQSPQEPALDLGRDILEQRSFGWRSVRYSKPILMRPEADVTLRPGRHSVLSDNYEVAWHPGLALVHVEMIDFDLWRYRKNRRPLSTLNLKAGHATDRFCLSERSHQDQWINAVSLSMDLRQDLAQFLRSREEVSR